MRKSAYRRPARQAGRLGVGPRLMLAPTAWRGGRAQMGHTAAAQPEYTYKYGRCRGGAVFSWLTDYGRRRDCLKEQEQAYMRVQERMRRYGHACGRVRMG